MQVMTIQVMIFPATDIDSNENYTSNENASDKHAGDDNGNFILLTLTIYLHCPLLLFLLLALSSLPFSRHLQCFHLPCISFTWFG